MAMGAASILLMMVSLEALLLLVAGTSAAAAVSGGTTIRLPSDGRGVAADLVSRAMARAKLVGDEKRPWECCDLAICTRSFPPICQCLDEVQRCSDACKDCVETEGSRHVCADKYWGDPGPLCHKDGNGRAGGGGLADDEDARQAAAAAAAVVADDKKGNGDDGKRPWECCDLGVCTLSIPPICRCLDKVDRCSDACKECEETEDSRHVCLDTYYGDPGPKCHEYGNGRGGTYAYIYSGLADAGKAAAAAAAVMANDRKAGGADDDDEKRPWKCCDVPICTRSWPPVCRCADTVERCASTCEHCEQVEEGPGSGSGGRRYRCLDPHRGDPGPSCGEERGGDHDWARRLAGGHRF